MRHRIFIAINLPENIKRELSNFQSKWPELPIRWTKPENLHITLVFLGYLSDDELLKVIKLTGEVAQKNNSFSINLNKICYAPPKKIFPRMIWIEGACPELVEGKKIDKLSRLQSDLENSLFNVGINQPEEEGIRSYTSHITLGRIRQWEFRQLEIEERPEIEENISLGFGVNSIEVMESNPKRDGPEYTVLESCQLKT